MASNTKMTCFDARLLCGLSAVSRTWVITKKLTERAAPMTDHDVKVGRGSAKTVGKFLCHFVGDPNQIAFMRIYQQIPITGTEDADHDTLARQAVAPGVCGELESFKMLQNGGYIVWDKVPGELLTKEFFWALDITARKDIRAKFRDAYEISKIIFDQSTGNLYISGFRMGWLIIGKIEWSEARYVEFELAEPSEEGD
ncbi:hypothetical protein N7463_003007 [Penicillium fimorum]|uniref:Uncharacterized protein n=1 Tax=Penicillium fimorum TaxID=1882269 RepID=A0A9X0C9J8_9EURO|nr:hypothetical protein N7463_003007 [Penicillium fimorum]